MSRERARDRHFRDPVHDYISFRGSSRTDRMLLDLVGTREVQRLRRIRQLGLAHLVFPGAEHSRFTHALGVMSVAREMLDALCRTDPRLRRHEPVVLAAALLHDIGHGPLSHAFEPIAGERHERWSAAMVEDEGTEVHRALRRFSRALPDEVRDLFSGRYRPAPLLGDLVSSQLDADRLDYLQRDVMATGVRHGRFDLRRILLFLLPGERRVLVDHRAVTAVEGYVIARAHMYEHVYYHKTVRAAESMLRAAVARARAVGALEGMHPGLRTTLSGRRPPLDGYLAIDDGDFYAALKGWAEHADPGLARLAGGLVHRRLLKCVEIPDAVAFGKGYPEVRDRARRLVARAGLCPDADLVLDESGEERYLPYVAGADRKDAILVHERGRSRPRPLEEASDLVRRLSERQVFLVRWFCPAKVREPLRRLVAGAGR
ncbi:MAG: HD domain-containing protein [Planctomycetes bacterium]|nr:HD domain-containing protein [Planctomycetota bacterium]